MLSIEREQILADYGYLMDTMEWIITHDQLVILLHHPVIDALLLKLIWQNGEGDMGLLASDQLTLMDMDGRLYPVGDEIRLVHPYQLYKAGILAEWQAYLTEKHIVQPIKQAFRDLYFLTPHEFNTRRINRFMGCSVNGAKMAQVLVGRGWWINQDKDYHCAIKQIGAVCANFIFEDVMFYIGHDLSQPITASHIQFTVNHAQCATSPDDIFPITLSEILYDATLAIEIADWHNHKLANSA